MSKKQVGGYILDRRIGRGSYATVWKGHVDGSGAGGTEEDVVAVKVISRQTVQETAQLRQEVEVLRRISHPNIVRFRDLKKSASHFYLVLEYMPGGDVAQYLQALGRAPEETVARRFLTQVAAGLCVLHRENVLHRDLKPQNLLLSDLTDNATLKIADFGFARCLQPMDMAATICGSPLYMAPEILRHEKYDARADLWSVGAILFELLVGRPPFQGTNPMQLLANIEKALPADAVGGTDGAAVAAASAAGGGGTAAADGADAGDSSTTGGLDFDGAPVSADGQAFLRALLRRTPTQRLSSRDFAKHPYVRLGALPDSRETMMRSAEAVVYPSADGEGGALVAPCESWMPSSPEVAVAASSSPSTGASTQVPTAIDFSTQSSLVWRAQPWPHQFRVPLQMPALGNLVLPLVWQLQWHCKAWRSPLQPPHPQQEEQSSIDPRKESARLLPGHLLMMITLLSLNKEERVCQLSPVGRPGSVEIFSEISASSRTLSRTLPPDAWSSSLRMPWHCC